MTTPDYHCPACRTLSQMIVTPTQAFCTADGDVCHVLMFNPSLPDGGMSNPTFVDLTVFVPKPASPPPVNVIRHDDGRVSPVCEFCGAVGEPVTPGRPGGRLSIGDVEGWSTAPYPDDFVHEDGSTGSKWTCRTCQARMDRGEALRARDGGTWQRLT